jgi:hypothetical protein
MATVSYRKNEVQFCAEVSKWADKLFDTNPGLSFGSSDIESYGTGSHKRQDFRVYERKAEGRGQIALCGEVKLPGTPQGRSPFGMDLMQDAFDKATKENCRYFFTWNVEHLALFDRKRWDAPTMHERCIGEWRLEEELNRPEDVARAGVQATIRSDFLPRFFLDFADIWLGRKKDVRPLPADFYVAVLESHLLGPMGPVRELRDYLAVEADRNKAFDTRLRTWMAGEQQWSFDRSDPEDWRRAIDRAARSMVYVLSNRILFYQAVRVRTEFRELPELRLPGKSSTPQKALDYLHARFEEAVRVTGDCEPVFFPDKERWAAEVALSGTNSLDAWAQFTRAVDRFNFKEIPTDILGHTFQKLISPDERHRFGQHYTDEDIVDVINAFCIRKGNAAVLDPACGSGTFLVRAYYRKYFLDKSLSNQELLAGLCGCDINPFPAHLATLNLAARLISSEENYPRVVRKNFFTIEPGKEFCRLPTPLRDRKGNRETESIQMPVLAAVIGNPPYVRHEHVPKASDRGAIRDRTKEYIYDVTEQAWPGLKLSQQSDLHVYFWPAATRFLAEGGWCGFLTSSNWLDVRYGFALQRWLLLNFRVVAIIESVDEPWFEDARVKTAVTIIQRSGDRQERDRNLVRFVRLNRPLSDVLGKREDEQQRQAATEELRSLILKARTDKSTDHLRIMVRSQEDLWNEGLQVAAMFAKQEALSGVGAALVGGQPGDEDEADEVDSENGEETSDETELGPSDAGPMTQDYGGGKWGRYLRAPDFYFEIMREFGARFARLGDVATIKRGITSGCDAFFMPRDVSVELLSENPTEPEWRLLPLLHACKRSDVESGRLVIVRCGNGTLHPIEHEFVRPEVHSLMQIDRPVFRKDQTNRVVLWVGEDLKEIQGTYAHRYVTWGAKQTFASSKSRPVPVPMRPTCASRERWYDVTGLQPGIGFWPKTQKYRHIIPWNAHRLSCNCNLYDIHSLRLGTSQENALMAILNSTLLGLFKHFYGRYAGSEGTLKTEIVDVLMMEIPSPHGVPDELCERLADALETISKREVTHLVAQKLLDSHTEEEALGVQMRALELPLELQHQDRRSLDMLVFELLGVTDRTRRDHLVDRLYRETALYYRQQRIQDIRSTINKAKGTHRHASQQELALDAWNELEAEWRKPLSEWLDEQSGKAKVVNLPEGDARLPAAENFFESATLYFGKKPPLSLICASRSEAELLYAIAREGLRGPISLPGTEKECATLTHMLETRLAEARHKFEEAAQLRAGTEKLREQVSETLGRWFTHGNPQSKAPAA